MRGTPLLCPRNYKNFMIRCLPVSCCQWSCFVLVFSSGGVGFVYQECEKKAHFCPHQTPSYGQVGTWYFPRKGFSASWAHSRWPWVNHRPRGSFPAYQLFPTHCFQSLSVGNCIVLGIMLKERVLEKRMGWLGRKEDHPAVWTDTIFKGRQEASYLCSQCSSRWKLRRCMKPLYRHHDP